jgi:hypothetical protein
VTNKQPSWPHEWTPQEQSQPRRFYIAAQDLGDVDYHHLPPSLVTGRKGIRAQSSVERDRRLGRELWATLGAWPWSLFGPDGDLPPGWRQTDLATRLA